MGIGLMTLGDLVTDPITNTRETPAQRHRAIVEAAAIADEVGFESVHVGEHHGMDYVYSSPPVILSAIGERTRRVKLSTCVTLAANLDPVRVAEDYATLHALSGGRAEMVVGRGNFFTTTYNMFGQDPDDSHAMFEENVRLILDLWSKPQVSWNGAFRAPLEEFTLQPAPSAVPKMWIGGGASESTTALAASLGLDLMLPSAFGSPAMFAPTGESFRQLFAEAGHDRPPQVGACWHVNVDTTSQRARERWEPRYRAYFELFGQIIKKVNPNPPPFVNKPFDWEWLTTQGPAIVGSPEEVVDRLNTVMQTIQADTNLIYIDMGGQPTADFCDMVGLLGTEVLPKLN